MAISFTLNGKAATIDADPDMPLLWAIREVVGAGPRNNSQCMGATCTRLPRA
jgi:aerobic-type carbon monoxide dehydrogenase small subunit (CoxS/CutS family)